MPLSLKELVREKTRRLKARRDFLTFCEIALEQIGEKPAAHHRYLIAQLQRVADGEVAGLIVNMPPGSAKSTYASVLFPAWVMQRRERFNILAASHTAGLAEQFSKRVQAKISENSLLLNYNVKTVPADRWEHTLGGEYKAAGANAAIAGFRADGGVIDDPIGLQADAENPNFREKLWNWYLYDFFPRLKPSAWQVIIQTRWHESDLSGRLIKEQPGKWEVVKIPAEAIEGEPDPLGRLPGEFLWGDDEYGYAALLKRAKEMLGPKPWGSLYQQDPKPMTGGIFKVEKITAHDAIPAECRSWVRAWDLAATKQQTGNDPDWTVGTLLGEWPGRGYFVADVKRFRGDPEEVEAAILAVASQDGPAVPVLLPQDPGQAGKSQVRYLTAQLAGREVRSSPESGDKETRAAPAASQANVGNLHILRADWNRAWLEELATFPGTKKDQVDSLSRAFNELAGVESMEDRWAHLS